MISVANLLDMEEEVSRRSFVRRLFAMGVGVAASGSLIRALMPAEPCYRHLNLADWDALLQETYVKKWIIEAVNVATPFSRVIQFSVEQRVTEWDVIGMRRDASRESVLANLTIA